ncbi:LacI family DNA-binding transcriptional regulator [Plantactinospora sp. GCM10030261]|uniref:LacI family DNA-binding transcriptional regulator n=1 Tax=Plantactinospora sp. GCM10030261 TaxID=3273420 RepID=UPI0036219542
MPGQTGRRRPTMAEVARRAGVSPMTVSYTYSQPARVSASVAERVHAAARDLGYPGPHPGARSLRRGRAGSLGVVLGEHLPYAFEDPQAARFLAGIAEVCADRAVGMTLVPATGGPADARRITEAAVDGFVVWTTTDDDPVLTAATGTGLPVVLHAGTARPGLTVVRIDDHTAARAIGRLAFTGARRPAVLSFPMDRDRRSGVLTGVAPELATFPVTRDRLAGYRDAWEDLGGRWSAVRVAVCARNLRAAGEEAANALLAGDDPPDALAAMSDELAFGALRAAAAAALPVPDALAVTGFDDAEAAGPAGLTTVHQSLRDQGAHCARLALGDDQPTGRPGFRVVRRATTRLPSAP